MIGIDTNVLLRYLIADDADQAARATEFLSAVQSSGERVFVSIIVLCETIWALRTSYKQPAAQIASAVRTLLETNLFELEQHDAVRRALELSIQGRGGIADYLIGEIGSQNNCRYTVTFDRALRDSPVFQVL